MAWLSLVIVTLIFFVPGYGIAYQIVTQNMITYISLGGISSAIPIPGPGSLRLFLIGLFVWAIVWLILLIPERLFARKALRQRRMYRYLLSRFGLKSDLVYPFQRYVSGQLILWLARFVFWGFIVKLIIGYLLQLSLDRLLPIISNWLITQFGNSFVPFIQSFLRQGAQNLTGFGLNPNGLVLLVYAVLVLVVNRAYTTEQHGYDDYAIQQSHVLVSNDK